MRKGKVDFPSILIDQAKFKKAIDQVAAAQYMERESERLRI